MTAISGDVPVVPREGAGKTLAKHGFVVAAAACDDTRTDRGWTLVERGVDSP
jgi:hypothetical protein